VRRALLVGVALVCVGLFLTQVFAQRAVPARDGAGATAPAPGVAANLPMTVVPSEIPAPVTHPPIVTVRAR